MDNALVRKPLGSREAHALLTAEVRLLEEYRAELERQLASIDARIGVLGAHYRHGAEQPSLDMTRLWG